VSTLLHEFCFLGVCFRLEVLLQVDYNSKARINGNINSNPVVDKVTVSSCRRIVVPSDWLVSGNALGRGHELVPPNFYTLTVNCEHS
jgi:hypothetical protein